MRTTKTRAAVFGVLALSAALTVGLTSGPVQAAKKKKAPKAKVFNETRTVSTPIGDAPVAAGPSAPVNSLFTLGKKFKNKTVGDVDVTFQTTGSAAGAAMDLSVWVSAPNGRTVVIWETLGDASIGPVTLDDDTKTSICDSATPTCRNPNATLLQPFVGRANTMDVDDDVRPLSTFNGVGMKGTWTVLLYDNNNTLTSTLNQVGIKVTSALPPR